MVFRTNGRQRLKWTQVERDHQLTLHQISQLTSGLSPKTRRNKGKGWEWLRPHDVPDGREHRWYAMSVLQDWVQEFTRKLLSDEEVIISAIHHEMVELLTKWNAQEKGERDDG